MSGSSRLAPSSGLRVAAVGPRQYDGRMGFSETVVLVVLAYLLFGPKKLPEIARQVGKAMNEFKRASNEFKAQIASEISQFEMESQRQIMPPAEPPVGSVPLKAPIGGTLDPLTPPGPENPAESQPAMKVAPDA